MQAVPLSTFANRGEQDPQRDKDVKQGCKPVLLVEKTAFEATLRLLRLKRKRSATNLF